MGLLYNPGNRLIQFRQKSPHWLNSGRLPARQKTSPRQTVCGTRSLHLAMRYGKPDRALKSPRSTRNCVRIHSGKESYGTQKAIKRPLPEFLILLVVMTLICMGVFACTNYLEQQSKTFVDMSKVQLIQLDEPESDAPAMKITTTAGTIVAELFPEQAPAYVKQFTELAESGYYDDTYVFSVEKGCILRSRQPQCRRLAGQRCRRHL